MSRKRSRERFVIPVGVGLSVVALSSSVWAASFTEEVKAELLEDEGTQENSAPVKESYIQKQKARIAREDQEQSDDDKARRESSVIDSVKSDALEEGPSQRKSYIGYTAREQARLSKEPRKSAIESHKSGKDELKPKKAGEISHAGGFLIGPRLERSIAVSGGKSDAEFQSLYTETILPDLGLSYEYELFRNRWVGSLALGGEVTTAIFKGAGLFTKTDLINEKTGLPFDTESSVDFRFIQAPVIGTLTFRLNWAEEVLQPILSLGYGATLYQERRDDEGESHYGYSPVSKVSAGVNISMDWIFDRDSWGLYEDFKIQKFYLSLAYSRWTTLSGRVDFSTEGVLGGMSYEF